MGTEDKDYKRRVLIEVYKTSTNSATVITWIVIGLQLIFLVGAIRGIDTGAGADIKYKIIYSVLLLLSVVYMGFNYYIKRDFTKRYTMYFIINPFIAVVSFLWAIVLSWQDYSKSTVLEPIMYITISLAMPLYVYMDEIVYCVIAFACDYLMLMLYGISLQKAGTTYTMSIPYLIIFFIIQISMGMYVLRLKRHLAERILDTESQKNEIEDLSQAQHNFFASMSHEIRTPINTIIGLDEMILRSDISNEVRDDAENIQSAGKILLHLLNDLLDISKIESGMMQLNIASYNTRYMFYEIWGMLSIRAQEKGLKFTVELSPDLPVKLVGDEIRIKQILINLINNSIKYTKTGFVSLTVECKKNNGAADIIYTVADSGIGIRGESLPHLFTAYKRVNEEKTKYIEGTGLGLSIVKNLLQMMDGDVEVTSTYGVGSMFKVIIPQQIMDEDTIGVFDVSNSDEESNINIYNTSFEAPTARILLVDDTPANIVVAKKLLRDTKVMIDTAGSGAEALELTNANHYDVIFMDHFMPNMDGIECTARIRKQYEGKCKTDTKIVVLTANVAPENEAKYLKSGFDGYLTKPITGRSIEGELLKHLPKNMVTIKEGVEEQKEENDEELNETLKNIFVSSIDETARKLNHFLETDDIENYTITVHGLKSTARLAGEMYISERAAVLEEAGKNNDKDLIGRLHSDFITEYMACKTTSINTVKISSKGPIAEDELKEAYMTISEYARAMDYTTIEELLNNIEEYELSDEDKKSIHLLRKLLDQMDYDNLFREAQKCFAKYDRQGD